LESGQTVRVITAPNATPNPAWLNFVVTAKARSTIRHFLKSQRHEESVELGERLLEKALSAYGKTMNELPVERVVSELAANGYTSFDELLGEIGMGNRLAPLVARKLLGGREEEPSPGEERKPIAIRGTEGLLVSYAKCCHPLPGDHVLGHLSAGRGIVVHRDNCKNVLAELRNNPEKCIALGWESGVDHEFSAALRIELINKKGVLATLATLLSEQGSNIENISMAEKDATLTVINAIIMVHDRIHLARIIKKLRMLSNVIRIQRL
jgi:guanosine-3',5'-bis(diphosphate) 3'-pyrophosphohydrolase